MPNKDPDEPPFEPLEPFEPQFGSIAHCLAAVDASSPDPDDDDVLVRLVAQPIHRHAPAAANNVEPCHERYAISR
jgi:hypothetical protein